MRSTLSFSSDGKRGTVLSRHKENRPCLKRGLALLFFFTAPLLFLSCSFSTSYSLGPSGAAVLTPVNEWLYRGSQPTEKDFLKLKKQGIRTVVNFRNEPDRIAWEQPIVEGLGMKYVSLPWSIMKPVKSELLDQFFEVLDDPANRPVFFHCKHGRDRTGVMTTLALMRYEGLSEEEARELALETIHPNLRYRMFVNQKIHFFTDYLKKKEKAAAVAEAQASATSAKTASV